MPRMTSDLLVNKHLQKSTRAISPTSQSSCAKIESVSSAVHSRPHIPFCTLCHVTSVRDRREETPLSAPVGWAVQGTKMAHLELRVKHDRSCLPVLCTPQAPGPSASLTLASGSSEHISEVKSSKTENAFSSSSFFLISTSNLVILHLPKNLASIVLIIQSFPSFCKLSLIEEVFGTSYNLHADNFVYK